MADFRKSTYELAQTLGNKRKNANKGRFTLDGDPGRIARDKSLVLTFVRTAFGIYYADAP
jgi:hypothetical protein